MKIHKFPRAKKGKTKEAKGIDEKSNKLVDKFKNLVKTKTKRGKINSSEYSEETLDKGSYTNGQIEHYWEKD